MENVLAGAAVVLASYLLGSIPFSNLFARALRGVDLRRVGTGTVSGSGLFRVAGVLPVVVAGSADVAKGAVGPLLAQSMHRPLLAVVAGAAAVVGHNWSVFLRFAGGRGLSAAMGALAVIAWPAALLLLAALALGRLAGETAVGALVAVLLLTPVGAAVSGETGALAGFLYTVLVLGKRLTGNAPPETREARVYLNRLLFDRDTREKIAYEQGDLGDGSIPGG